MKTGDIGGFHPRTLHICSPEYLEDEFDHIENSFLNFRYPKSLHTAKSKAYKYIIKPTSK